ncbi:MAG: DNA-processing protein DprA, partial [Bacteroidaceae bacterium]|nr:DNA-processing protein DprA [Bacteroidaceae bacterium]
MDELLLRIALSMTALRPQEQRMLLDTLGSATQLYNELPYLSQLLPNAGKHTKEAIAEMARYVGAAEKEIEFAEQMGVKILTTDDANYPHRMLHAEDAPTVLYMKGGADLNAKHIVSIVGTRHCTP